jgi:hypothetical protein
VTSAPVTDADAGAAAAKRLPLRIAGVRLPPHRRGAADAAVALGLGGAALALYAATLLPGVGYTGDTAKWQYIGHVGGVPHATGYPLYLMLNGLWVDIVPLGSSAWRANLLSAVCGAAAVALLYLLLRALDVRRAVAAATSATFACTYTFWTQSVVAEVYTLHILLLTAVIWCLARWRAGASDRWLLAGLAVYALSFGNHMGTVLALPGVAWLVWSDRRRAMTSRNLAWVLLLVAVGAGQYAYLFWMSATGGYVENSVTSVGDIIELVRGDQFENHMFAFSPRELLVDRVPLGARLLAKNLLALPILAVYGACAWPSRHRDVGVCVMLLGAASALYALEYDVVDVVVFFLPTYLALAVFVGVGAEGVAAIVTAPDRDRIVRRAGATVGVALLVLVPVGLAVAIHPRVNMRDERAPAEWAQQAIDAVGRDAVIVTDVYKESEWIRYHLLVEGLGQQRDVRVIFKPTPAEISALARSEQLFTTTPALQAQALEAAGLRVTLVPGGVWRVSAQNADGDPDGLATAAP